MSQSLKWTQGVRLENRLSNFHFQDFLLLRKCFGHKGRGFKDSVLSRLLLLLLLFHKGWMMKTLRRWLWPWVEEAALTLTSVRNALGRFPLRGLLLFLLQDLSRVQIVNTLIVLLSKWPLPSSDQWERKKHFWCHLKFHTTMQDNLIWGRRWLEDQACPPPSPLPTLLISSPRGGQWGFLFLTVERGLEVARVWAVCSLHACLRAHFRCSKSDTVAPSTV